MKRFSVTLSAMLLALTTVASAQVIFQDDFESYTSDADLYNTWVPSNSNGDGILVDETYIDTFIADPTLQDVGARAFPSGGQGVEHLGSSIMEVSLTSVAPSATQDLVVSVDIFDTIISGNKRLSLGLRSNAPENLVELGFWNTGNIGYAHRGILFPTTPDNPNPNWAFFEIDPALDRDDDNDDVVNPGDVGEAWHTYRAIISEDQITYEIDLYRDGLQNSEATEGVGTAGVDASVTYDLTTGPNGFDSLRIGGPSGLSSPGAAGVLFDNVLLELVAATTGPLVGDYNNDGSVDAADYTVYRDTLGDSVANPGDGADGNSNGVVDPGDYTEWVNNYGSTASAATAASVPEPAAGLLLSIAAAAFAARRRV